MDLLKEKIHFYKMEGAGNDYVYIDSYQQKIDIDVKELAPKISHRRYGVGADGLVVIAPSDILDLKMIMFNADGSESEMCGNAIRCVARFAYEKEYVTKTSFKIETKAGPIGIEINLDDYKKVKSIRASMGAPVLQAEKLPSLLKGMVVNKSFQFEGFSFNGTLVSMGNPHIVIFVDDLDSIELEKVGPLIENDPIFPSRINVEFVQVLSRQEVKQLTWERGSGETWACGTGACAVAVASILNNLTDNDILVHLKGGDLNISWQEGLSEVFMEGPAKMVFEGDYYL